MKVSPIFDQWNVNEIIGRFGWTDRLRIAFNRLQSLLNPTSR